MSGAAPEPVTRAMWITLAAMTVAASMILVDQTAVPLAIPRAVDDLGGTIDQSQWILTANILPLAAFMVLGGRVGDLVGLRRAFLAGAVVFGVATTATAAAQSMPWMIAARAVQGCGAAVMMPTSVAIVSTVFPRSRRGTALGVLAGGSAAFAALGPVLGGLLTSIDWRLVFVLNLGLAIATTLMTLSTTPDLRPAPDASRHVDVPARSSSPQRSRRSSSGSARAPSTGGTTRGCSGRSAAASSSLPSSWPSSAASASRSSTSRSSGTSTSSPRTSASSSPGWSSSGSATCSRT